MLKREMEFAMFDALVEQCQARGIRKIVGVYIPSKKNSMVAGHYASLGFRPMNEASEGRELWSYDVPATYSPRTRYIRRTAEALLAARKSRTTHPWRRRFRVIRCAAKMPLRIERPVEP